MYARSVFHTGQKAGLGYIRRYDICLFYKPAEAFRHPVAEIGIVSAVIGHRRIDYHQSILSAQKLDCPLKQPSLRLGRKIAGIYRVKADAESVPALGYGYYISAQIGERPVGKASRMR